MRIRMINRRKDLLVCISLGSLVYALLFIHIQSHFIRACAVVCVYSYRTSAEPPDDACVSVVFTFKTGGRARDGQPNAGDDKLE
jgi:hypothetical protein